MRNDQAGLPKTHQSQGGGDIPWAGGQMITRSLPNRMDSTMTMLGSRPTIVPARGTVVVCLVGVALASGQAAAGGQTASTQKPVMAEDILKNVQVLRGIPLDEFMGTMGFFAAALSLNCTDCHVGAALDNWERY